MTDIKSLYQEIILDHGRHPRCFGELEPCDCSLEGLNPVCGDRIKVFLEMTPNQEIKRLQFNGEGCAISVAAASLLCGMLTGLSKTDALKILKDFQHMLTGDEDPEPTLKKLAVLAGVKAYPTRVKCATLAAHAIQALLTEQLDKVVSTEG